jgi:hypothetical protein
MSHTLEWLRRSSVIATAAAATAAVAYSVFSFVSRDGIANNVSWSDDHGKSLTEVFKSDTDNDTDADDDEVHVFPRSAFFRPS